MARFTTEVPMRWADMDAYRHVNNTAYLAYLEQARIAMFFHRHEGFSDGTVISRHEVDYLRPIVYHPGPLRVDAWVDRIGGARFTIRYEIYDGEVLAARAATVCATFDFDSGRPRRLTGEERDVLLALTDGIDGPDDVDTSPDADIADADADIADADIADADIVDADIADAGSTSGAA